MTSSTSPAAVVLRSCADLLSSVPYLLGFHPVDSVVVVAFRGRRARFAARSDLPGSAPGVPPPGAVAARFVALLARERVDAVALVGYGAPALVTPALDALRAALAGTRIVELDVLRVEGGRYWSYVCHEPSCCPPSGVPFDPATPAAVAAVVAGRVALPDRASLVRAIAPVEGTARASMRVATERAWRRLGDLLDARAGRVSFAAFTPPSGPTPPVSGGVGEAAESASAGLEPGVAHPATTRTQADDAPARSAGSVVAPSAASLPGAVDIGPVMGGGSGHVSEPGAVEDRAPLTRPAGEDPSVGDGVPSPVERCAPRVASRPGAVDGGLVVGGGSGDVSESGAGDVAPSGVERGTAVARPAGEDAAAGLLVGGSGDVSESGVGGVVPPVGPRASRGVSLPGAVEGGLVVGGGSGNAPGSGAGDVVASEVENRATVARPPGEDASVVGGVVSPVELPPMREVAGRHASRPGRGRSAHPSISVRQRRLLLAAGRVALAEALAHHGAGRALTDDDVAWLSVLLTHIPVRDHAWEHTDDDERHVALWSDVVRRVDPVLAAAPAALLAFAAWRSGHGALAAAAVDRALSADPGYPMALLMEEVLDQCVAPSSWRGRPAGRARRRRRGRARGERETP